MKQKVHIEANANPPQRTKGHRSDRGFNRTAGTRTGSTTHNRGYSEYCRSAVGMGGMGGVLSGRGGENGRGLG